MSLPKLPGYSFPDPQRTNFAKTQQFGYKNGYTLSGATNNIAAEDISTPSDINLAALTFQTTSKLNNAGIKRAESYVPPSITNYKKVLSFSAYWVDEVEGVVRYRNTNINYFLEDDTIQIVEPKTANSGIPQGVLLRRQTVTGNNGQAYTWKDLGVGVDIFIYGREYHITDADAYTRSYYGDNGIELHDPFPMPATPENKTVGSSVIGSSSPTTKPTGGVRYAISGTQNVSPAERMRLRKFLDYDNKVLRFYCLWDDSGSLFGEKRPFVLHYFLVDDNIEVREVATPNSGRDPYSTFIKKQRLPKKPVSGGVSALQTSNDNVEYYTDEDLRIGETVNIFGRNFLLYDADAFTREYYGEKYGITDFPVVNVEEEAREIVTREIPEYTGFGSEEDSLANCLSLVPKPPRKNTGPSGNGPKKQYNATDILRFSATLRNGKKEDEDRQFVVSYHLQDDTMSVFENPIRGIRGGKFTERKKIKNPGRGATPSSPSSAPGTASGASLDNQYYVATDLYVGAIVSIFNHLFELTSADQATTNFIMEHKDQYDPAAGL